MHVLVEFLSTFRGLAGRSRWQSDLPEGADVKQLLDELGAAFGPELGKVALVADSVAPGVVILINGHSCDLEQGPATILRDGDVVSLLVHITGG